MIITVQGMNHKNNKAVQTVSTLAGMDSLINGNKTLIVQLINPDIDVEIPLYKEECHALSEKIAILDKAEPELPKENNEKEFVQLEFDFDKE